MRKSAESIETIKLGHGGGGQMSQDLFQQVFQPRFSNEFLNQVHDGAIINLGGCRLAISTDSFVVKPIFFPGGNIGDLAINGTVNDVAMCGADPKYLAAGFILEEGFPVNQLQAIVDSMQQAAQKAGVVLVTGDTKVVEHGSADGIFINTTGIGIVREKALIAPTRATIGDVVIINGRIADHGIAVMSKREGMEFESTILSDCAALNTMIGSLLENIGDIHVLRDPTRGGIAATLNEIAGSANVGIVLNETAIPIDEQVKAIAALLGLDPLYIANEGKVLVFVKAEDADRVVQIMKRFPEGQAASVIGEVVEKHPGRVVMETTIGTKRIVDMPAGLQLPRIC